MATLPDKIPVYARWTFWPPLKLSIIVTLKAIGRHSGMTDLCFDKFGIDTKNEVGNSKICGLT